MVTPNEADACCLGAPRGAPPLPFLRQAKAPLGRTVGDISCKFFSILVDDAFPCVRHVARIAEEGHPLTENTLNQPCMQRYSTVSGQRQCTPGFAASSSDDRENQSRHLLQSRSILASCLMIPHGCSHGLRFTSPSPSSKQNQLCSHNHTTPNKEQLHSTARCRRALQATCQHQRKSRSSPSNEMPSASNG